MHQLDQPAGVPPLALDGERTLPDIPLENYWFRRHLIVYEWIAARSGGLRIADLACGEGYGAAVLAENGAEVVGIDANPSAHQHASLRYRMGNLSFIRDTVEGFQAEEPFDAVVFLQTIEHLVDPNVALHRIQSSLSPGGTAYISTPNRLTLAPPGASKSDNPWHVREYVFEEFRDLLAGHFDAVEILGLFHARLLAVHDLALKLGWDRVHSTLRATSAFYDRFVPALGTSDFTLKSGPMERALDFVAVCSGGRENVA